MSKKISKKNKEKNILQWIFIGAIGLFIIFTFWGVAEYFSNDRPEMEAYKCDNPNCGKIHYRQKVDSK